MAPDSLPALPGARAADALGVTCPCCRAVKGETCVTSRGRPCRTHARRDRRALVLAAHHDPALDAFPGFGPVSQCGLCGTPGLPQRHRVVDAIAGGLAAGEDEDVAAEEYGCSREAVDVVKEWMTRWRGAWL
jgi:hypothetical protein